MSSIGLVGDMLLSLRQAPSSGVSRIALAVLGALYFPVWLHLVLRAGLIVI